MTDKENLKSLFTCSVEPRWNKKSFTIRKKVKDRKEALTLACYYRQLSGGFNDYSNFRFEGRFINTSGYIHLKTGKLKKVS